MEQVSQELQFKKSSESDEIDVCGVAENFIHALNKVKILFGVGMLLSPRKQISQKIDWRRFTTDAQTEIFT